MFTRNFRNLLRGIVMSSSGVAGVLPMTDVYGMQYFYNGQFGSYPYSRTESFTTGFASAGISVGSDNSEPTLGDYRLRSPITSGVSGTVSSVVHDMDGDTGTSTFLVTVTNTSSNNITIGEICFKQTVRGAMYYRNNGNSEIVVMLDRTVLASPITLQPREATVISYRLETEEPERTVGGVKVVSWQYGSEEDVVALIEAARAGTVDLRTDCGWQVGDMRRVLVSQFTAGGVTCPSQYIDVAITSFDEYQGCGNVIQADFSETLTVAFKMNQTSTNAGGYGGSQMKTEVLPALFEALPAYLKECMLEFDVLASAGSNSSAIETVVGNKLALRSEVEVRGDIGGGSFAGEGAAVPWYQSNSKMRQKYRGRGGSTTDYLLRSPASGTSSFTYVYSSGTSYYTINANSSTYIAPFMCL